MSRQCGERRPPEIVARTATVGKKNGNKTTLAQTAVWRLVHQAALAMLTAALCAPLVAQAQHPPFNLPSRYELNKLRSAVLSTNKGEITFELYPEDAPWHVANFKFLADRGFYRGKTFHIYYPNYIIQGGAPSPQALDGGPGYELPAEFNKRPHEEGTLGMARRGDGGNPERNSNGSQFHIVLGEAPNMDGSYTVFGKVIRGFETLRKLEKGDTINELIVFVRDPNRTRAPQSLGNALPPSGNSSPEEWRVR